ncbi:hypothetical protein [Nocardia noduli]|uniref:hypothetical protein n=1 Tax=Nocardia noduli TaxID=2815722 RepID=UPI001C2346F8|nr:hypothetical protein [Nocardia noduli]
MTIDPTQKLATPEVEAWWSAGGKLVDFALGNAYSVTYYLNLIISLTGFDPIKEAQEYLGGDWEDLLKSAKAVENLAEFNSAYSASISEAMKNVESSWNGNAAASADDYFAKLTAAIDAQVDPLTQISNTIATFAWEAYGIAQAVQALILELGDLAIQWVVTEAAAAASAGTGVGAGAAIVFQIAASVIAASMVANVVKQAKLYGSFAAAAAAAAGLLFGLVGTAVELEIPSLGETYDHPGVN